ncbi:centromere protein X-like [Schistocerca americana]|uniref:centromere protein X-like n=1 Tax=Schistocerca americana TaxID=7009 RepID=UPI001F4F1C63|nr:centromere protein X-like [Schistocerca americana]
MENVCGFTDTFVNEQVLEIIKLHFKDDKTKVREETACMVSEIIHKFVIEGLLRAKYVAWLDGESEITYDHMKAILPTLNNIGYGSRFVSHDMYKYNETLKGPATEIESVQNSKH